ncbi:acetate/propionate family kinase [Candidatus Pacearchaeota archaeon]|nr:acetate/propionate family kinase [Candidatus Pacearchaeota archaeon]
MVKSHLKSRVKSKETFILTINGGSSSIKFALFETSSLTRVLEGKIDRIGLKDATLTFSGKDKKDNVSQNISAGTYKAAVDVLISFLEKKLGKNAMNNMVAVGHRIVHGGLKYNKPEEVDKEMLAELHNIKSFSPEHLPGEILLMETFSKKFPGLKQIACFDTAFHREMPKVAHILPIPRKYYDKGIRRYGFHGISYSFLMDELSRISGKEYLGKIIIAHLGNGCSLAAVNKGKSVDTSMGFTPTAGIPMSTRSGDIDPGLVWYLARTERIDAEQFNKMINSQSGLFGVSEISSDMRDLLEKEEKDKDERAKEAIDLFCYQIRKFIGSYSAAMNGLDTLIFSAGIGENAPKIRKRICQHFGFLGIELDEKKNNANSEIISSKESKVIVRVIKTDEELMIAKIISSFIK